MAKIAADLRTNLFLFYYFDSSSCPVPSQRLSGVVSVKGMKTKCLSKVLKCLCMSK